MTESGKIATATALSVLAHVTLFTALALMPETAPAPPLPLPEDPPLEVTIHAEEPQIEPAAAQLPVAPVVAVEVQAIQTQIDPENLKKADRAPEHPTQIAAHDSVATAAKNNAQPTPSPVLEEGSLALQPVEETPKKESDAPGIDALGNFGKAVGNAIGVRSEYYRQSQKQTLAVGEVKLKFAINAQGQVSDIRILSNSALPANAAYAARAVQEAKIPPIPRERLAQVPGGRIEIVYTFTIYPTQ